MKRNISLRKKIPLSLVLDIGKANDYKEVEKEISKQVDILENIYI